MVFLNLEEGGKGGRGGEGGGGRDSSVIKENTNCIIAYLCTCIHVVQESVNLGLA